MSLEKYALANIALIRVSLDSLSKLLSQLRHQILDLQDERRTGTYTPDCSRSDLADIARTLGEHSTWKLATFAESKKTVMSRYGISSTKFAKAVNSIRASRPLAALVGLESSLKYIQDDKLVFVMERWSKLYSEYDESGNDTDIEIANFDLYRMKEHHAERRKIETSISSALCLEELADLETIFYIGREHWFGEMYEEHLERTLLEYRAQDQRERGLSHLLDKTNLLHGVIQGCENIGRPSLARRLAHLQCIRPNAAA